MSRDVNGNYTLPSGNPVVTATTITSTWANTTMADIATVLTNSLDRNGNGAMLAALKGTDGTAALPAYSFGSDTALGIYRVASGQLGFSTGGTLRGSVNSTGNWVLVAPSSGVTLALTSISGQYFLTDTDGTCSFNAYNNGAGGTHLGTTTNHPFAIFTNGFANERVVVAAAGNVTIAAPSSGLGLAVTGLSAITTAAITAISTEVVVGGGQFVAESRFGGYGAGMFMASRTSSGGTLVSMAKIVADGTASWDTTASNQMARLSFWTANTGTLVDRGGISSTGSWTINAPSSGDPLTLNGTAATTVRHIRMQGTTTAPGYIELNNTGGNAWFALESSGGGTLITGAAAYSTVFGTTNATELNLIANSAIRLKISSAGNVTIGGGVAITAGGIATTGVMFTSTATFGVFTGSGAPSMSAAKGSLYLRSDGTGTTDRAYINTNGTTTWTALTTVA